MSLVGKIAGIAMNAKTLKQKLDMIGELIEENKLDIAWDMVFSMTEEVKQILAKLEDL